MENVEKLWRRNGLDERDIAILSAIKELGGKARWKNLEGKLTPNMMSRRTLSKHLKSLEWLGFVKKEKIEGNREKQGLYTLQFKEVLNFIWEIDEQLRKETSNLLKSIKEPNISFEEREKRLLKGVDFMLNILKAWALLAIKLSLKCESEEHACKRALKLFKIIVPASLGNALWLCWLNKNIAEKALRSAHKKPLEEPSRTTNYTTIL